MNINDKPVIIIDDKNKMDNFIMDCLSIYDTNKKYKNSFCGIDIEYNTNRKTKKRYIGIIQIIFITNCNEYFTETKKPIYIFSLNDMKHDYRNKFIKYILCSTVKKIFHGSDSLDYPILYESLLQNKDNFMKFINSSIDTRFLCELSKRLMDRLHLIKVNIKKCSIYDALLDHGVISDTKYIELNKYSSNINYNTPWIITKLKKHQILYSMYDVVYLYDLLYNITNMMKSNHKSIDPVSLINRMYRFHIMNKLKIINISDECKNINISNNKLKQIDELIKEKELCDVLYTYNNKTYDIKLYIEDVLSLDTIRKNINSCLRIYQIDTGQTTTIDRLLKESTYFNMLKGKTTILYIIDLIRHFDKVILTPCND